MDDQGKIWSVTKMNEYDLCRENKQFADAVMLFFFLQDQHESVASIVIVND